MCRGRVEPDHMAICSTVPGSSRAPGRSGDAFSRIWSGLSEAVWERLCSAKCNGIRPDQILDNASPNAPAPNMHPRIMHPRKCIQYNYFAMHPWGSIISGCVSLGALSWDAFSGMQYFGMHYLELSTWNS